MENIIINFGDVVSELRNRELVLCNRKTSVGLFLLDKHNNLYMIENYYLGSYLDKLIKNSTVVEFKQIDKSIRGNVEDWELENWDSNWIEDFIKRQHLDK